MPPVSVSPSARDTRSPPDLVWNWRFLASRTTEFAAVISTRSPRLTFASAKSVGVPISSRDRPVAKAPSVVVVETARLKAVPSMRFSASTTTEGAVNDTPFPRLTKASESMLTSVTAVALATNVLAAVMRVEGLNSTVASEVTESVLPAISAELLPTFVVAVFVMSTSEILPPSVRTDGNELNAAAKFPLKIFSRTWPSDFPAPPTTLVVTSE